ncbi:hypothetical protein [Microbacterium sp. SORGH_AS_0862]|uniref:hypothetical protein n=1 Tax=Microbacterium sp. SORGH_AS_0862 TaxID=3041789 RepID=UPI00278CD21A|nr:hypothetical protein [Microbacterium sp. SORGH_AS_0862]MDQ1203705.1 hypothetical protein [Microbacterium sp. SORGH_AS_0862]
MSNPDQPSTPPLTRRQMRDLRNTGSTPIQTTQDAPASEPEPKPEPAAPLPRAAEPAVVPPAPRADASVDLGVSPLTRRQAREQERIRTASVPVITPDTAAQAQAPTPTVKPAEEDSSSPDTGGMTALFTPAADERPADEMPLAAAEAALADEPAPVVSPQLGSALLEGGVPEVALPPSFDHLLTREGSTGSVATPNALILSQTPSADAFTSPIAATGEVLITGTFALPEGLGSRGHAPGTTDGKEADAVLVDGELPPASSPTPIAASAAISTIKSADEIIRPPAPEKGSRLMLVLAITAGALALALVGVLVFAVSTGLFS